MNYHKYPIRICRTMHDCEICHQEIRLGEEYYDGGYKRRAHKSCIDGEKE
jgi:hypothetical protein